MHSYSTWSGLQEGIGPIHGVQPREVQIAAIQDINRDSLRHQNVEHIDVVQLAARDVDEAGNAATQIQQRVHLGNRLGSA